MSEKVYVAEKITRPARADVDQRIFEMRLIGRRSSGQYGIIQPGEVFVQQAQFMADFTCDAPSDDTFFAYYPTYDMMTDAQLKSYFSWRTRVRQGQMTVTSLSSVFVYIYELLNQIGVSTPLDGFQKLSSLLKNYAPINDKIVSYLRRWMKDYYLLYPLQGEFQDLIQTNEISTYFSDLQPSLYATRLETLHRLSSYKFLQSPLYQSSHRALLDEIYRLIIPQIAEWVKLHSIDWVREMTMSISDASIPHTLFASAVHGKLNIPAQKEVRLHEWEVYQIRNHQCYTQLPLPPSGASCAVIGQLFKRIDYSLKLTLNMRPRLLPKNKDLANKLPLLGGQTIDKLQTLLRDDGWWKQIDQWVYFYVKEHHPQLTLNEELYFQRPVKINTSKLNQARQDAQTIRERLITSEDEVTTSHLEVVSSPPVITEHVHQAASIFDEAELLVLRCVLVGKSQQKELVRVLSQDYPTLLLEVVVNQINEKCMEHIGDQPLFEADGSYAIYEEYRNDVQRLVGEEIQ